MFKTKKALKSEIEILQKEVEQLKNQVGQLTSEAEAMSTQLHNADVQMKNNDLEIESLKQLKDDATRKKNTILNFLYRISSYDNEQLAALPCNYEVRKAAKPDDVYDFGDDDNNASAQKEKSADGKDLKEERWEVVTSYCSYGGCDISTYFKNETAARIYALVYTELGVKPGSGLCPSCRVEYYKSLE